jgi:hypothetical protein
MPFMAVDGSVYDVNDIEDTEEEAAWFQSKKLLG